MAYGLEVRNGDNQIILDSSEGFPTFIKTSSGTTGTTAAEFNFPSGITPSNLLFMHLPGTGEVAEAFRFGTETRQIRSTYTASKSWIKVDVSTSNVSGFDSGYGLNVFDGTGTAAADLLFSSNTASAIDIVNVGTWDDLKPSTTERIVDITDSTAKHYVLINGSHYGIWLIGAGQYAYNNEGHNGYKFNYSGTTLESITIISSLLGFYGTTTRGGGEAYMIVKERS